MTADVLIHVEGPPLPRRLLTMHVRHGAADGQCCKDCRWLVQHDYRRRYYKCLLYGVSSSAATDWRLSYPACGKWEART
jgi:hypothetical protein